MVKDETNRPMSDEELADLVASTDTGARSPIGPIGKFLAGVALFWSLFQLWIASPLSYALSEVIGFSIVLNNTETRSIHLALAVFLGFCAYPALKRSPRNYVPIIDWVWAIVGGFCASYYFFFYEAISSRPGLPTDFDLTVAGVGLVCLLEATRRALGPPLMVVAIVFLLYVFFGNSDVVPEVIQWKGASFQKAMSHLYLTTEGVFGVALGVSTSFVFLFVLFGSLLDKGGAGNYFIKLAFALLGHLRGGPAKAAVLASAMTGLISGSSIANVVTTGTFTIPLMKRVGFSSEKAGSVEVASSVNGQIMPPVMGAAAFLMVEYVGISYVEVIKHAFLPATISYIALLYLVHLEAVKNRMSALPKQSTGTLKASLLRTGIILSSIFILAGIIYFGINAMKSFLPDSLGLVSALVVLAIYIVLMRFAAQRPDLEVDDPNAEVVELPKAGDVVKTGLHYILPIVVLVWFLMIERKSPGLSAFWAALLMIFILLTQHPLKAFFRGKGAEIGARFWFGFQELIDGLIAGARNMIGIAVATAAAGIIVGTVTLTGIGQKMAELVEWAAGGSLMLGLAFTAIISLILGMGLPTTANYIVVSSLMAPVVIELGAANGLILPLIAVHLFVFYFGIMADVTPPVGLASFAAAAVSGGDPIKTGFTAFFYSLRTVVLPFLFIFNTDLLLIDVSLVGAIFVFIQATAAMLIFAAATQGYFFAQNKAWETVVLLLVAFTLFRPGFWLDYVQDPYIDSPPAKIFETVGAQPPGTELRVQVEGPDFDNPDKMVRKTLLVPLADSGNEEARFSEKSGLLLLIEGDKAILEEPLPGSLFSKDLQNMDFYGDQPVVINQVRVPNERLPKELFFIPALLALAVVIRLQSRRAEVPAF
ncbi:TRAP transporter permease [Rhodovibrionaceae bacterium A322]